jgi:NitT/TauT family transport system substrate-binding protein
MISRAVLSTVAVWLLLGGITTAQATEVRIARQYGIGYLQFMVMERNKLVEKHAAAASLKDVETKWSQLGGGASATDGLLSGEIDFAALGTPSLVMLWAKTSGEQSIRGVATLNSYPMYLNTRDPSIRSIEDFSAKDRIAVPAVGVSSQAIALQMAAAKTFGKENARKLDPLTVSMKHPDATIAMITGSAGITSHFTNEPFSTRELEASGIHTVLNSFDVYGGPATAVVVVSSERFHGKHPEVYKAFLAALEEATDFINKNRREAAQIYMEMSGDKSVPKEKLVAILKNPQFRYTVVPENVMQTATFMAQVGLVKKVPSSWKDMFFPEIHNFPGS